MNAAEDKAFLRAQEIVRQLAVQRSGYHRVCPVPWTTRLIDWLLRFFGA